MEPRSTLEIEMVFKLIVKVPEVGNTADTLNPLGIYSFKGNLGVPTGQRKFGPGGV